MSERFYSFSHLEDWGYMGEYATEEEALVEARATYGADWSTLFIAEMRRRPLSYWLPPGSMIVAEMCEAMVEHLGDGAADWSLSLTPGQTELLNESLSEVVDAWAEACEINLSEIPPQRVKVRRYEPGRGVSHVG